MKPVHIVILFCIIIFAAFLRFYGINWDQGFHLHPDERAIVMYTLPLQTPSTLNNFFSTQSTLNPHFFAYGSFPLYLLRFVSNLGSTVNASIATYDRINILGRGISALFDLGTILLIFFLGKRLFSVSIGLLAAFFYSISVLPIQTSHFYAVDIPLTFLMTSAVFLLILFYDKPNQVKSILIGLILGLALATKNSAIALLSSITIALIADFLLIFLRYPHHPSKWKHHVPIVFKRLIFDGLTILIVGMIVFFITEPYSLIDLTTFISQTNEQSQMTHNAYIFPYTLQYVGKIPYLYELRNIFLWGQGPFISLFSFIGIGHIAYVIYKKNKQNKWAQETIILAFVASYFLVVGHFAVGFMRYMLPIYPFLSLFGALLSYRLFKILKQKIGNWSLLVVLVFIGCILIWPLSFMHIYTRPNTRVLATDWILKNVPVGSAIAIEHWDDGLPLLGQQNYHMLTLPLYDPDSPEKWSGVNKILSETDYIIIASNRLYVPLQKMTDCVHLPPFRCYTQTAQYYKKLFSGKLGFNKVAEFSIYPTMTLGSWSFVIDDQSADESFTVYDHPIVMVFKKSLEIKAE